MPPTLNYFSLGFDDAWFEPVSVPGTAVPGFVLQSTSSLHRAVLSDVGGTWHAAADSPTT